MKVIFMVMHEKYFYTNNLMFWGIVVGIYIIITILLKFFIPKEKKIIINIFRVIKEFIVYIIGVELIYRIGYQILYSLH